MEYCKKCGAKVSQETGRCVNCGWQMKNQEREEKKSKKLTRMIIAAVAVVMVLFVGKLGYNMVCSALDSMYDDGYQEVLERVVNSVYGDSDMEAFLSLMPEEVIQKSVDEKFDGDKKAFKKELKKMFDEISANAPVDSLQWKIKEEKTLKGVELKHYQEAYRADKNTDTKIKYAKAFEVGVSYKDTKGKDRSETMFLILGSIDGTWYMLDFS